jgi:DNA polymerase-1
MIYLVTKQKSLFDSDNAIKKASVEDVYNYFADKSLIEFDTETNGFDAFKNKLISSQYGDSDNQFVVDHETVNIKEFKGLLENPDKTILMQNAKFDLRFLYVHNIFPVNIYDTYLAESLIHLGDKYHSKSLLSLCYNYLGVELDKTVRGDIAKDGLTTRVIIYAANDVRYLSAIREKQLKLIEKDNLQKALKLENQFVKVLAYVEYCGFKLNIQKWKTKILQDKMIVDELKQELDTWILNSGLEEYIDNQLDLFSDDSKIKLNWKSSKQVVELFKKLGIKVLDKHGKESVDSKVLVSQKGNFDILPIYLKYKAAEKVSSTYGESFLEQVNPITRRIHTNFTQLMDTGRLSSGGNKTINFQNIPSVPEYREGDKIYERECFEPEKGNTFVVSDYSGQEAVIFANKCLDKNLLAFYDEGLGDQHSYVAKLCYPDELADVPLDQIKKVRKDLRQNAKAAGFALQFGGVGMTIAANLNISIEEGNAVETAYYNAFPGVKDYFKKVTTKALETKTIVYNEMTKHRLKPHFVQELETLEKEISKEGFWSKYREEKAKNSSLFNSVLKFKVGTYFKLKGMLERMAKNYPVQGTAAAMTKLACIYIFKYIIENNLQNTVKIVNLIHDEIVVECPQEMGESIGEMVKNSMEKAGNYFCKRVPLSADPYVGDSWTH